ncbi:hypothetical protein V6N11_077146 [Hibiscus sabdariffa]|uniref:Uncharacterized protein n=1 Tax=Hibiscus sabdariffa TaxID=183260 RepID=A0ABR2TC98_9ROSI
MKARRVVPVQQKGRIRFHEEVVSSNSHSDTGVGADVPSGAMPTASATPFRSIPVPVSVASSLGVATATSLTVLRPRLLLVFMGHMMVSHEAAAPVAVAPAFDAIEEWLAEDNDSDVQVTTDLPVKIPAKRSSGGSDPSKAKWARSITTIDEVVTAFRDIGPGKAPGIDGFPSSFFRLHWNTIGSDFT